MKKYRSSPNRLIAKALQEPGRYAFITWLLLLFCSLNLDNLIARTLFVVFTVIWSFVFIIMILNRRSNFDMECEFPRWATAGEKFKLPVKIKKNKGFNGTWFFRIIIENHNERKKDKYLRKLIFNTRSEEWHNRWAFNDNNDYGDNNTAKIVFCDFKLQINKKNQAEETYIEGYSRSRGLANVIGFSSGKRDPFGWLQNGKTKLIKPTSIIIIPKPRNMPVWPSFKAKQAFLKKLESKNRNSISSYNGDEFMNIREARREDPLKYTHWKSWAKTGKRWVVEQEEITNPKMTLVVDITLDKNDKYQYERFEQMLEMVVGQSFNTREENNLDWVLVKDKPISVDQNHLKWNKVLSEVALISPITEEETNALWERMNPYWKNVVALRVLTTRSESELLPWLNKWKKRGIFVEVIRVPLIEEDKNV